MIVEPVRHQSTGEYPELFPETLLLGEKGGGGSLGFGLGVDATANWRRRKEQRGGPGLQCEKKVEGENVGKRFCAKGRQD